MKKMSKKEIRAAYRRAASNFVFDVEDFFGPIQCISCRNRDTNEGGQLVGCKAFPEGIVPIDILLGRVKHDRRHPDQINDSLYEPEEET